MLVRLTLSKGDLRIIRRSLAEERRGLLTSLEYCESVSLRATAVGLTQHVAKLKARVAKIEKLLQKLSV